MMYQCEVREAPWSAVAPATAFMIDQNNSLLTEKLKRGNSVNSCGLSEVRNLSICTGGVR
jgi:hypothetical protein